MHDPAFIAREGRRTLDRLRPRLAAHLDDDAKAVFLDRLERRFPDLFNLLLTLYGDRYDFHWHLEKILTTAALHYTARGTQLKVLDAAREGRDDWFLDHRHVGAVLYVDRFAGDLEGLRGRLDYLEELGVTYLHLMPPFKTPPGDDDGGYAVSDYRALDPGLGDMDGLAVLAATLRSRGISLVLDFVLNHTADDHAWAERAKAGERDFQDYYWMFDDRALPDAYAAHLRPIFPERGGDAFVWRPDVAGPNGGKHVWSTFYPFQWDLNYRNPAVFDAVVGEMLFLANQGVEVLRLDAVPFLWKELGSPCENLPEAHTVVAALNAITDVAAPALIFKSEAIVHPDEVARYVDPAKCHLSYNPLFMVLLWEALATRDTRLMRHCLETRVRTAAGTSWVNYVRGHDDIGWGFADEDCHRLGIDPIGHRNFLNAFYTGRFQGSFARGLPFQENHATGDCRISGTAASLAGLEGAVALGDTLLIEHAIRRLLLMHGMIVALGGIPLLYVGDEVAQLNDGAYARDPRHAADNRWTHRPLFPQDRLARARRDPASPEGRVFHGLKHLLGLRRRLAALGGSDLRPVTLDRRYLVAYLRRGGGPPLLVVGNFCEHPVSVARRDLLAPFGGAKAYDHVTAATLGDDDPAIVAPYAFHILESCP